MEKELEEILKDYMTARQIELATPRVLLLFDVSRRSEQLCQHSWAKHPSHPKIGAMVCLKCGSELA